MKRKEKKNIESTKQPEQFQNEIQESQPILYPYQPQSYTSPPYYNNQNFCSTCNSPLYYFSQNNSYFCPQCQKYEDLNRQY